jgi:hypothetical protein
MPTCCPLYHIPIGSMSLISFAQIAGHRSFPVVRDLWPVLHSVWRLGPNDQPPRFRPVAWTIQTARANTPIVICWITRRYQREDFRRSVSGSSHIIRANHGFEGCKPGDLDGVTACTRNSLPFEGRFEGNGEVRIIIG